MKITGTESDAELREAFDHLRKKAVETDTALLTTTSWGAVPGFRSRGDKIADEIDTIATALELRKLDAAESVAPVFTQPG